MAPVPPDTRLSPESTPGQPSQTVRTTVGGVQVDVIADIALNPQVVGVAATQRPAPPPVTVAPAHSTAPPREPDRWWWVKWFLGIVLLLGLIGVWQNINRSATVLLPVPAGHHQHRSHLVFQRVWRHATNQLYPPSRRRSGETERSKLRTGGALQVCPWE
jgi:hypothetical protein